MITLNPTSAPVEKHDVQTLLALISLLADPAATKARLTELAEKKAELTGFLLRRLPGDARPKPIGSERAKRLPRPAADHASKMQQERQTIADERARHAAEAQSRQDQINRASSQGRGRRH